MRWRPLGVRGDCLLVEPRRSPQAEKQIRLQVVLTDDVGQTLATLNQHLTFEISESENGGFGGKGRVSVKQGEINFDTFTGRADAAALLGVTWAFEGAAWTSPFRGMLSSRVFSSPPRR